ncbi:hypothetical protein [Patulibacter minatonensis]|uniref:hypothetical protein n=1 Tax=Patulibacter minatonensis TaxID=298163 RepID=UPI00047CE805|nr:hypothetical protein [Patulibacter minatonensis]
MRSIDPADRAVRDGIPCTSPARTLLDLATVLDARRLDRALRRAETHRHFDRFALEEILGRRRAGTSALRAALAAFSLEHASGRRAKSELELRFHELLSRHGFVMPSSDVMVPTPWGEHEVDNHWPEIRLVIETDGWETHCDRESFRRDHEKAADLKGAGYAFLWLTWEQVVDDEARLVERLDRLIPRRAADNARNLDLGSRAG